MFVRDGSVLAARETGGELLLQHILGRDATWVALNPGERLTARQLWELRRLIKKRSAGWPAAYLLGYRYFMGLRFFVNRSVLVPRPESEYLVERGLEALRSLPRPARVLDVGTGSGCIITSLAKLAGPHHRYEAADVSEKALSVARKNARAHGVRARFFKSNLLERAKGLYDLVLANLPYVPASDYKKLRPGLRFEPKLALTDGTDRFTLIGRFIKQLRDFLAPGGTCLLEIDPKARPTVSRAVTRYFPGASLAFSKDLAGRWRYAEITVPK